MANKLALEYARSTWNWTPHSDGQRAWLLSNAKVKVAACGRRWGKSESTAIDIATYALQYPHSIQLILSPRDENRKEITEKVEMYLRAVRDIAPRVVIRQSPSWRCTVFHGKGRLPTVIRSRTLGATGLAIRGRNAHRVIVDEAAFVDDSIMRRVVTPLLADFNGDLILISSPAGRNHFYESWQRGQDPLQPRYESFQFPSCTNPYLSQEYLDSERATMPDREYRIEYGAEFADAEGLVFRNVAACCEGDWLEPELGAVYAAGLDLARLNDFTVLSVIDRASKRLVFQDRFNKIDWPLQVARIAAGCRRYNDAALLMETNSIGDVLVRQLRSEGIAVSEFLTTAATKPDLIDGLAAGFERGEVRLPAKEKCPVLVSELLSYAYERSASGYVKMSAPEGRHDDCVMSLALAWRQVCSAVARTEGARIVTMGLKPEKRRGDGGGEGWFDGEGLFVPGGR